MSEYRRMIRCPNGKYEEFQMVAMRHNPDNPKEVTLIGPDDIAELSKDSRDNHFSIGFICLTGIKTMKKDSL